MPGHNLGQGCVTEPNWETCEAHVLLPFPELPLHVQHQEDNLISMTNLLSSTGPLQTFLDSNFETLLKLKGVNLKYCSPDPQNEVLP